MFTLFQALQEHYHHSVSKVAHNIDKQLPKGETDLSSLLETTVGEVLEMVYFQFDNSIYVISVI